MGEVYASIGGGVNAFNPRGVSWKKTLTSIDASLFSFQVDTILGGTNSFDLKIDFTGEITVDWGDGNQTITTDENDILLSHTYNDSGVYDVTVSENLTYFKMFESTTKSSLVDVKQWGACTFTSMNSAFIGCSNLKITATDTPDLSLLTNMNETFEGCHSLENETLSGWDISTITTFYQTFKGCINYNGALDWDLSNANDFREMFSGCVNFNQPLTGYVWNGTMQSTFFNCNSFNQDLSSWDVSGVTSLSSTFNGCDNFEGLGLDSWNISNSLTSLQSTFNLCSLFNADIDSWDTSNVTAFYRTFYSCSNFNKNLSNWNTANGSDFRGTFQNATIFNQNLNWALSGQCQSFLKSTAFNQDVSLWTTTGVTTVSGMFSGTPFVGLGIENFDVSQVTEFNSTFENCTSFNGNISGWDLSSCTGMYKAFRGCSSLNQDLSAWNTSNITDFRHTFELCSVFEGDGLDSWDVTSVTHASSFLNGTAFTNSNYQLSLVAWTGWTLGAPTIILQNNTPWNFGSAKYEIGGESEDVRGYLVNTQGCTIVDGGGI